MQHTQYNIINNRTKKDTFIAGKATPGEIAKADHGIRMAKACLLRDILIGWK
ncbi:hypothetical protein [Endozoicomonas sp. ALB032]|uniref:hypothetical protein n=1 Tax=Endozoicomonas sp. ALB032 TaxID=3403082 RepID=UPI003BB78781